MNSIIRWTTAGTSALGLWLLVAPFVLGAPAVDRLNDMVVGLVLVFSAGYNFYRGWIRGRISKRNAELNCVLGAWLIIAPFVIGVSGILLWNDVAVGVLTTAFAGYHIYVAPGIQDVPAPGRLEDV